MAGRPITALLSLKNAVLRDQVERWFQEHGYALLQDAAGAGDGSPDVIVLGADEDYYPVLRRVRREHPNSLVVMLPRNASSSALDVLGGHIPPHGIPRNPPVVSAATALLGDSPGMQRLRQDIRAVARSNCNVIVTGETGTGKELVARSIHESSARKSAAFISINCAALPDSLVESELFGYEKGAFTGASSSYPGKLTLGHGGTIFLDEVGDMSLYAQAKLLRAIEDRSVFRLGALRSVPVDFRLISATNRDLHGESRRGLFRLDLYYRLKVAHLDIPPLRARRDDIPLLAGHYVAALAQAAGDAVPEFSAQSMERLCLHDWPGNVRELRNVVEAALVRAGGAMRIESRHVLLDTDAHAVAGLASATHAAESTEAGELEKIQIALDEARGNKSVAAERLRWSRMTLYRKLAKHHLA